MDESLVDGVSERAHFSRDCVSKLGGPSEMEVRTLVNTTEQAIQAFLKEDCESNIALINSLEEISFKLWLEANIAFLHENSLCEDGDADTDCWQWDEECFFTGSYRSSSAEDCAGTCTPTEFNHHNTMSSVVGMRQTELCCQKGLMLTTEQADSIGLVDQMVPAADIEANTQDEMNSWLSVPDSARQIAKASLRQSTIDRLIARREEDIANVVAYITAPSIQKALGFYLQQLKKKSKT